MDITKPDDKIFSGGQDEQTINELKYYGESLDALVNIGTYILKWEAPDAEDDTELTGSVIGLIRRAVQIVDSCSILIKQGCVVPCIGMFRVLVELELQLEFLLKDPADAQRKAQFMLISELHEAWGTAQKLLSIPDIEKKIPIAAINAEITEYQNRINHPVFNSIRNTYLQKITKNDGTLRLGSQKWFWLSDNVPTVTDLITKLPNKPWHSIIYSDLSKFVHSSSLMVEALTKENGNIYINKIRNPIGAKECVISINRIILAAYATVIYRRTLAQKGEYIKAKAAFKEHYSSVYPQAL